MKTSQKGIELIKRFEGLRLFSYPDAGAYAIGYGHTKGVRPNQQITKEVAERYLKEDLHEFETSVNKYVVNKGIPLTQNQFDALVSLVYNVGAGSIFTKNYGNSFGKGSTLYNHLKNHRFKEAAARFTDFKKANGKVNQGLLKRREQERDLFLSNLNISVDTSTEQKKNSMSLLWLILAIISIKSIS